MNPLIANRENRTSADAVTAVDRRALGTAALFGAVALGLRALGRRHVVLAEGNPNPELQQHLLERGIALMSGTTFQGDLSGDASGRLDTRILRTVAFADDGTVGLRDRKSEAGKTYSRPPAEQPPIPGTFMCSGAEVRIQWKDGPVPARGRMLSPLQLSLNGLLYNRVDEEAAQRSARFVGRCDCYDHPYFERYGTPSARAFNRTGICNWCSGTGVSYTIDGAPESCEHCIRGWCENCGGSGFLLT
jgi:hypothetical protein